MIFFTCNIIVYYQLLPFLSPLHTKQFCSVLRILALNSAGCSRGGQYIYGAPICAEKKVFGITLT